MKAKISILIFLISLMGITAFAQMATDLPVTDSAPVNYNGLVIGYSFNSEEVKAVSDKGDFSRFSIKFYVTNTTQEAKMLLHNNGFNLFNNDISSNLAEYTCLNATGARLTSKSCLLQAPAARIIANVEDKDPSGKTIMNRRLVEVGYWIRPGETISTNAIMIVPLNTKPDMRVKVLWNTGIPASAQVAAQPYGPPPGYIAQQGYPGQPAGYVDPSQVYQAPAAAQPYLPFPHPGEQSSNSRYYNMRNFWKNTYVTSNQQGPFCDNANVVQGITQWDLWVFNTTPLQFNIRNKFYGTFLTSGKPGAVTMSPNNKFSGAVWTVEYIPNSDKVWIKNVGNNTYLNIESGTLQSTAIDSGANSSWWVLEGHQ